MNSEMDSSSNRCGGCNDVCEKKSNEIVALHLDRNGRPRRGEQTGHIVTYKVPLKQLVGEEQKARELACRAQIQRRPTVLLRYSFLFADNFRSIVVLVVLDGKHFLLFEADCYPAVTSERTIR
jgi:hypothetical protein